MSRKILFISITLVLLAVAGAFAKKALEPKKVHYHAGFVVVQNGQKMDFSDNKYMDIEPCVVKGKKVETPGQQQLEKAHLHDNVGDVVHSEAEGAIWQDLFTNIKFPIDAASASGYINGKLVPDFLHQPIVQDDSLVVLIGESNPAVLVAGVSKEYIEEQGQKSKTCGD